VTLRDPTELPQAAHRYSYSSPSGRTRSSLSRTGRAAWQREQKRDDAWNSENVDSGGGAGLCPILTVCVDGPATAVKAAAPALAREPRPGMARRRC
jgi:hypothetical protein